MRGRSEQWSHWQRQSVRAQKAHHAACALQLPELGKDQEQTCLHFFIRIEDDGARSVMSKPGRQRQAEFASRRFLALTLMEAHPDLVKLRLAHDAGQAEQQTIVVGPRIVETLAIRNEHAEHRAEFEELMPVAIVAGQPRSIEADHETGIAEADFGDQLLEAVALDAAGA